ncbi:GNAT family N-acetyltransferase [Micromonospora sp. WMMD812]|uniref:GNAT family N-acetyltransferase n=1 Tax=Micromonospora sp. WMMD812 TaxID=3015152 RepID=UPI00248C86FB|nr:GNAT family N-acetyltransferase [Micromonospora sp. WMMD812]WBB65842.1 GNAT family N-acetyltransferase [Micromonospora sp. WMMD812]
MAVRDWPAAEPIETERLVLEPLRVGHAEEMAPLLDDERLHEYVGGRPDTPEELRARYARQVAGHSPDGAQGWLNWIVRHRDTGAALGVVQATVRLDGERAVAELAWVVAAPQQGRGYAGEAAAGMVGWLDRQGIRALIAHVHPDHRASARVAERLGLRATDVVVDGELRWATP